MNVSRPAAALGTWGLLLPLLVAANKYVAPPPTGSDTANDGNNAYQLHLTNASYTAATRELSEDNAFSAYVWTSGDKIRLTNVPAPGLYEIEARPDAHKIKLTASSLSSDLTGIQSTTGPYATLAKAVNKNNPDAPNANEDHADTIHVAAGNYPIAAQVVLYPATVNHGNSTHPITINLHQDAVMYGVCRGGSLDGAECLANSVCPAPGTCVPYLLQVTGGLTYWTIQGGTWRRAAVTVLEIGDPVARPHHITLKNMTVKDTPKSPPAPAGGTNVDVDAADQVTIENVTTYNGQVGLQLGDSEQCAVRDSTAYECGADGFCTTPKAREWTFEDCVSHDNGDSGFDLTGRGTAEGLEVYGIPGGANVIKEPVAIKVWPGTVTQTPDRIHEVFLTDVNIHDSGGLHQTCSANSPNPGAFCTANADCRVCVGGTNPGTVCTSGGGECWGGGTCPSTGRVCVDGQNDGQSCSDPSDCPGGACCRLCDGGQNDGQCCTEGANCPGGTCPSALTCVAKESDSGVACEIRSGEGEAVPNQTGTECRVFLENLTIDGMKINLYVAKAKVLPQQETDVRTLNVVYRISTLTNPFSEAGGEALLVKVEDSSLVNLSTDALVSDYNSFSVGDDADAFGSYKSKIADDLCEWRAATGLNSAIDAHSTETGPSPYVTPVSVQGTCISSTAGGAACGTDADCGTNGTCVRLKSRSLSISNPSQVAGTSAETAIRVRSIDLYHPSPPNSPARPQPNFSAFDTMPNNVCTGPGPLSGYYCQTGADCTGSGTCPPGVGCTAQGENNGCVRYVGPPFTYLESRDSPGIGNYKAARLQCTPECRDDWSSIGVTHVVGSEIVPSSTYELQVLASSCAGSESTCADVSCPITLTTSRGGDVSAPTL